MDKYKWKLTNDSNIDFCIDDKNMLDMQTLLKSGCLCDNVLSQDDIELLHKLISEGIDLELSLIMSVYYCNYSASRFLIDNGAKMYDINGKKLTSFTDMNSSSPIALLSAGLNAIKLNNGLASLRYSA